MNTDTQLKKYFSELKDRFPQDEMPDFESLSDEQKNTFEIKLGFSLCLKN